MMAFIKNGDGEKILTVVVEDEAKKLAEEKVKQVLSHQVDEKSVDKEKSN